MVSESGFGGGAGVLDPSSLPSLLPASFSKKAPESAQETEMEYHDGGRDKARALWASERASRDESAARKKRKRIAPLNGG